MAILKALKKIGRSTEDFDLSSILEIRIKINPDEMLSEAEEELVNEINSLHSELQQLHIEELKLKNKQEFKEPYLAELESCQLTGPITDQIFTKIKENNSFVWRNMKQIQLTKINDKIASIYEPNQCSIVKFQNRLKINYSKLIFKWFVISQYHCQVCKAFRNSKTFLKQTRQIKRRKKSKIIALKNECFGTSDYHTDDKPIRGQSILEVLIACRQNVCKEILKFDLENVRNDKTYNIETAHSWEKHMQKKLSSLGKKRTSDLDSTKDTSKNCGNEECMPCKNKRIPIGADEREKMEKFISKRKKTLESRWHKNFTKIKGRNCKKEECIYCKNKVLVQEMNVVEETSATTAKVSNKNIGKYTALDSIADKAKQNYKTYLKYGTKYYHPKSSQSDEVSKIEKKSGFAKKLHSFIH